MKSMSKTSLVGWFMLITAIGMGLELLFNLRIFVPLLIGFFFIYISMKKRNKKGKGNIYLIAGISLVAIAILSSAFFKFFIIATVIYFLIHYSKYKKEPHRLIVETAAPEPKPSYKKRTPFIKNRLFGNKRIVNEVFEWDDINIQCGFGDTVIDLGMTMFPPGESVVVIRSFVGDVQLLVPFDANIIVNHSTISGKLTVFNEESELFNSNLIYYPDSGETALRTVKIITNVMIGNVEVKRI
ncbi:cell wall-active antibiotics response protein LiaF [Bacillus sp. FSL K6-3431]|uniref:cell wall-active antibiotics response protein LiaF n=1 Tax=Bacillus sp. FSL K6-3431 TaxID=2921500 RepID=UPI0030F61126